MAHYKKITIYPVLKNLRDALLKVSVIDPGYLFSKKYIENARIKRKILFTSDSFFEVDRRSFIFIAREAFIIALI